MFVFLGYLVCFLAGAAVTLVAQRVARGGSFREQKAMTRLRVILQNVEAYDGTGAGQKEVPGN